MDMKKSDGVIKSEVICILSHKPGIKQDVEVFSRVRSSYHWMVRCKIILHLQIEGEKLVKSSKTSYSVS